ncbi:MAG: hypothetical protein JKY65_29500 [Planctomycetes bacterium]|nr:hypothetical protein [Planctomycetota bacterium]
MPANAFRLLLTATLLWAVGCATHEHLHVYGQVLDVTKHPEGTPVEGAEIWTVSPEGKPAQRLGTSDRRGGYEVEVPPPEQAGGIGVRKAGYRAEWWPIGRLNRSERRAHTVELDLPVVRPAAPKDRPRAGKALPE